MPVVATAGHVDHGKSTLVRALTGTDPDRLAEERRRGLTIELGYAWTDLPGAGRVSFVDVPGHERFLGTMLAGVGPVPAVLLVVAADEGWRRQTAEHVAALDALGVRHGLVAVTRADLADPAPTAADTARRLAGTTLAAIRSVGVSASTGRGLDELRTALAELVRSLPAPPPARRLRVFVDRVFSVRGAGTVVTATLPAGTLAVGDALAIGASGDRATVRALESCRERLDRVSAVARVAVNLRGVDRPGVRRGDALLSPGAWQLTGEIDVELRPVRVDDTTVHPSAVGQQLAVGQQPAVGRPADGAAGRTLPAELVLHVGSASRPTRVRVLAGSGGRFARLRFGEPLPLEPGDVGVLRDPGRHSVAAGVIVHDVDPPPLDVRGSARARAGELAAAPPGDLATRLRSRRMVHRTELDRTGVAIPVPTPDGALLVGEWVVDAGAWTRAATALRTAVEADRAADPASAGLPEPAAVATVGLPDPDLLVPLAAAAGAERRAGRLVLPGDAGPTVPERLRAPLRTLAGRLGADPFAAPDTDALAELGLARRDLSVLAAAGAVLHLPGDVVLLPDAAPRAAGLLAALEQPFTVSAARQALGTSRRVAVPLLERMDRDRLTIRTEAGLRRVRTPGRHITIG